jgi:hypothetical protein
MDIDLKIAHFMGVDIGYDNMVIDPFKGGWTLPKYSTSPEWLKLVVTKIETIHRGDEYGNFKLCVYGNSVCWNSLPPRIDGKDETEATLKIIETFINWYKTDKL